MLDDMPVSRRPLSLDADVHIFGIQDGADMRVILPKDTQIVHAPAARFTGHQLPGVVAPAPVCVLQV